MSIGLRVFFLLALPFPLFAQSLTQVDADSLFQQAAYHFTYQKYPESLALYQALLADGVMEEDMLYRMAYMHEQLGDYAQAIYFLRLIQYYFGGENLEQKIALNLEEITQERRVRGEVWTETQLFFQRNQLYLMIALGILALGTLAFTLLDQTPYIKTLRITLAAMTLTAGVVWLGIDQSSRDRCVIVQATDFYRLPGYGAEVKALPWGPGTTLKLLDQREIWCKVGVDRFEAWIPQMVIRRID